MSAPRSSGPPLAPVLTVWAMLAVTAAAAFITYSWVPARRLYHVSGEGLAGGLGSLAVFLSFPAAILAVPLLPIVVDRVRRTPFVTQREARFVATVAALAGALCLTVAVSVKQSDLDVRPLNAATVAGTLLAAALTAYAARRTGVGRVERRLPTAAWLALAAIVLVSLPWISASWGLPLARVPLLQTVFNAGEHAVHLGQHHGYAGALAAVAAILSWPSVASMTRSRLRSLTVFLVALELSWGLANALQDGWLEQIVKRGWTNTRLPEMLLPSFGVPWAVILAVSALLWWFASHLLLDSARTPGITRARPTG